MPGSWQPLANQPAFKASTMLLLTDGTVMAQESNGTAWWRLTPDEWGDYANGTWSPLAAMIDARLYYASAVLADGRVFVAGGEYNGGSVGVDWNRVEIYDPVANAWQPASTPGWTHIGDAPCCVLPDGRVLLGSIDDTRTAIYDPGTGTWSPGADKADSSSEEGFTLMPDDTVLAPENSNPPYAEKYLIAADTWVSAGQTPVSLVETSVSIEIGPCLLRPDGTAFQVGADGHTAVYRPDPDPATPGTWTAGPDFPDSSPGTPLKANDAPGCVLPNGHVLCVAGTAPNNSGYAQNGQFFEFDGKLLDPAPAPANAGGIVYDGRMLVLPTGQVLFSAGSPALADLHPGRRGRRPMAPAHHRTPPRPAARPLLRHPRRAVQRHDPGRGLRRRRDHGHELPDHPADQRGRAGALLPDVRPQHDGRGHRSPPRAHPVHGPGRPGPRPLRPARRGQRHRLPRGRGPRVLTG